jgi:competence protein ComEA
MRARFVPYFAGILSGLLIGGILWLILSQPRGAAITLLPPPSPALLRIHVAGAVRQPGVYSLPAGSLVAQAIEAAGGPADSAWLDAINLAERVLDGDQVRVPYLVATGAEPPSPAATSSPGTPAPPVNLNTASASELDRLPGIGPSLAQEIIDYREAHGAFGSVEDLLSVPGIGPAKLEAIRDMVLVN